MVLVMQLETKIIHINQFVTWCEGVLLTPSVAEAPESGAALGLHLKPLRSP